MIILFVQLVTLHHGAVILFSVRQGAGFRGFLSRTLNNAWRTLIKL